VITVCWFASKIACAVKTFQIRIQARFFVNAQSDIDKTVCGRDRLLLLLDLLGEQAQGGEVVLDLLANAANTTSL